MAEYQELESILKEIQALDGVYNAVLVARNGMHIAGMPPEGVFQDTFDAMCAILLGAAENVTSDLKERVNTIVVNLEATKIVVMNDGPKALFVVRTRKDTDEGWIKAQLDKFSKRVEEIL